MPQASLTGLNKQRLGWWLGLFFLALGIPTGILIHQAYSELKWEAFHQYRLQAEELAARINVQFIKLIDAEEARPFTDYAFLNIAGEPSANFLQRSPLSAYPVTSPIPGLIGYFQVDAQGALSTPLLPQSAVASRAYGLSEQELQQRELLAERIQQILSENRLVQRGKGDVAGGKSHAGAGEDMDVRQQLTLDDSAREMKRETAEILMPAQAAFDQLNEASARAVQKKQKLASTLGRVDELKLDYRYQDETAPGMPDRVVSKAAPVLEKTARKERSTLPETQATYATEENESLDQPPEVRIRTFESEIDPFQVSLLDSGHFVLFRKVWRDGQRYIQGAMIEQQPFFRDLFQAAFHDTALSNMSDLILAYQGNVISAISTQSPRGYISSAQELTGALLFQTRLSAPLSDLELIFSVRRLPAGPGGRVIIWAAAVLILLLCGGFYLLYRVGVRQIDLVRQQQDFVSAVSHELKTPLTSIRMYGEILREGWASEEKKRTYYAYIHDESERLSRLIANVLQLARMTRNDVPMDLQDLAVSKLMETVRSKVSSQIERAGFTLNLNCEEAAAGSIIRADADTFAQVVINLVDNAIKFAGKAENKHVDIDCRLQRDGTLMFSVRDYGPGVPKDQMKKIFKLFYRSENELTRETVGTGIGLALVHQLMLAMKGQVDVINKTPGVEFRLSFPALEKSTSQ